MGFVEVIAGITDKRNMHVPAGFSGMGANRAWREFATCFKEWKVSDKSLSKQGVEVEFFPFCEVE